MSMSGWFTLKPHWLRQYLGSKQTTSRHSNRWWPSIPTHYSWWRHQMETFSALLAICAGNSPVHGEFPAQRPVTRSFDVFLDLRLNKRFSKQSWSWWFETLSCPLWRHCNVSHRNGTLHKPAHKCTDPKRLYVVSRVGSKSGDILKILREMNSYSYEDITTHVGTNYCTRRYLVGKIWTNFSQAGLI